MRIQNFVDIFKNENLLEKDKSLLIEEFLFFFFMASYDLIEDLLEKYENALKKTFYRLPVSRRYFIIKKSSNYIPIDLLLNT